MAPKLSDEQRQALIDSEGKPLEVEDEQTQKVYVLVAQDEFQQMVDEELRRQLQIGFDRADRGELEDWDVEAFLQRMNAQHPTAMP